MPKGYWVAHVNIDDPQAYERYKAAIARPFSAFGARFLVRGGSREMAEGTARARTVVIEFPSYQAALDCDRSADYQAARRLRDPISAGDIAIVEGYDGPQP